MEEREIRCIVQEDYKNFKNKWLGLHVKLLAVSACLSAFLEIVVFALIYSNDLLTMPADIYGFKYLLLPVVCMACIAACTFFISSSRKMNISVKEWLISTLFTVLAFVLSAAHSGFIAVLAVMIFPVLMTNMYENWKLTAFIAVLSVVLQICSGLNLFWDPNKVIDSQYVLNLIILISTTFFAWLACLAVQNFFSQKREIMINNDVERYMLQALAHADVLTGVGNKRALLQFFENIRCNGVALADGHKYFAAMLDIDGFKMINDNYGHPFGDDVLSIVGEGLKALCTSAYPFRFGGDEFFILFQNISIEDVTAELEKMSAFITDHTILPDGSKSVTLSIGIAVCSRFLEGIDAVVKKADKALYSAKVGGGGRIVICEED